MPDEASPRRRFLAKLAVATGGAVGLAGAGAGLVAFAHPLFDETTSFDTGVSILGATGRFPKDTPVKVTIKATRRDGWTTARDVTIGSVWVTRLDESRFQVLSTECPHLGCTITLAKAGFECRCHNSRFGADGARVEPSEGEPPNPAPRGMDELTWEVTSEGMLAVTFRRFRSNTAEQVAIDT